MTDARDSDATRLALAMVRADWQEDEDSWNQLWALADDPGQLARELTRLCREQLSDTALGVVKARVMLEAKRCLIFTSMSIKETAAALEEGPSGLDRQSTRTWKRPSSRQSAAGSGRHVLDASAGAGAALSAVAPTDAALAPGKAVVSPSLLGEPAKLM